MFQTGVKVANEFISDQGIERGVQVLALIGAYTTGKLVVKAVRKGVSMLKTEGDE